ncbi:MAG: redox-regulated ATPase YchF [Candidatus Bilamarchaeaceae archaeon]
MAVTVGVVGKPNAGKSTFFSALTMAEAKIAAFPFTTLEPNIGVGYVRKKCPHAEISSPCSPRDSFCRHGIRFVPVRMMDVAGLVPDAHKGRGLGFQFLDDLMAADAFIQVVDASGATDLEGKPAANHDPAEEILFLKEELFHWLFQILERNWKKVRLRDISLLSEVFSGLKISEGKAESCARRLGLPCERIDWDEAQRLAFAKELINSRPMVIAANKCDENPGFVGRMKEKFPGLPIIPCSALYELALKKADKAGTIEYLPGSSSFKIKDAKPAQKEALSRISSYLEKHGNTGVQQALETLVFEKMGRIVVFPVEDESRWSDRNGNVLPNAFLLPPGSTALQMAEHVHTDLAKGFVSAIDARTKRRLGREHPLKDCDVIKIFSK